MPKAFGRERAGVVAAIALLLGLAAAGAGAEPPLETGSVATLPPIGDQAIHLRMIERWASGRAQTRPHRVRCARELTGWCAKLKAHSPKPVPKSYFRIKSGFFLPM